MMEPGRIPAWRALPSLPLPYPLQQEPGVPTPGYSRILRLSLPVLPPSRAPCPLNISLSRHFKCVPSPAWPVSHDFQGSFHTGSFPWELCVCVCVCACSGGFSCRIWGSQENGACGQQRIQTRLDSGTPDFQKKANSSLGQEEMLHIIQEPRVLRMRIVF